jgi:hypothetical protein
LDDIHANLQATTQYANSSINALQTTLEPAVASNISDDASNSAAAEYFK